jgi:hypothetical protein
LGSLVGTVTPLLSDLIVFFLGPWLFEVLASFSGSLLECFFEAFWAEVHYVIVWGVFCLMGLFFIFLHFMGIGSPEGWPSLIVSILFIGGIQLIALGTIGEYVGRSFLYQNKEPQYIIDEIEKSIE